MSDFDHRPRHIPIEGDPALLRRAHAAYRVEPEPSWIDLGDILGAFRRNVWLILIVTAVCLGAAAYLVSGETTRYRALAIIRLFEERAEGSQTVEDVPMGKPDPIVSELMVLQSRNVLGRAVDRGGLRIFSHEENAPASFIAEAQVTLDPGQSGTIHLDFMPDSVSYGPTSDRRTVAYGQPIVVDGARFVVPTPPARDRATLWVRPRDTAIDYLAGGIETETVLGTGGVMVYFSSQDPWIPAAAVNAIVQEYQLVNAEMARENVMRRRSFLEEQLRNNDSLLMVAQTGLSGFRAQEQAYSASGRFTAEQGNLIGVEIQQAQLSADLRMYENILNQVMQARASGGEGELSSIMSLPGISSDPVVSQLFAQLVNYRTERQNMVAGSWARAETHPEVRRLDTLISSTEGQLVDAVRSHIGSVRAQISALGALRGRAAAAMSQLPRTEVQEVYLTQNVSALQQMGDQLREQYQAVRLEEAAEAGRVEIIQLATRALPIRPSPWNKLFLGLVAGLMLGAGLALVREKLDHSINRPEDVEDIVLVPNLAVIPASARPLLLESGLNGDGRRAPLDSPGAEAYRILRTNLLFSQGDLRTLVVTSAAPGEGKTMTAANLAAAIANQGRRVLLMECDLRRPSLARYFKDKADIDLSSVLLENRSWEEAIHPSGIPGLDLMLASRAIPRAAEFLAGSEMREMLGRLSALYDMVILDTSPLLVAADATVLGAIADGVLLVVRTTHTDREAIQQAVHQLSLVGANVVGTVLNDPDGTVSRYGAYYDYSAEYESA